MKTVLKLFLIDEQSLFRQGLRALLENDSGIQIIGEAASVKELPRGFTTAKPDVIVLDPEQCKMPLATTFSDVIVSVKAHTPGAALMILSATRSRAMMSAAIQADAQAFLLKTCSIHEVRRALTSLAAGKRYYDAALTDLIRSSRLHGDGMDKFSNPITPNLTSREREVLQHLARGFSAPSIASHLSISRHTVANHRRALMQKLNCSSSTALVAKAVARGLVRTQDETK